MPDRDFRGHIATHQLFTSIDSGNIILQKKKKKNRRINLYQIVGELTLFAKVNKILSSRLHSTHDSKSEQRKIAKINNNFQNC